MRQPEWCAVREGIAEELLDAPVDAVAGHLGGQREIHSLLVPGGDELLRGEQGGLGFAAAHRPLDHDDTGLERCGRDGLLNRVRLESGGGFRPEGSRETCQPQLAARPADLA